MSREDLEIKLLGIRPVCSTCYSKWKENRKAIIETLVDVSPSAAMEVAANCGLEVATVHQAAFHEKLISNRDRARDFLEKMRLKELAKEDPNAVAQARANQLIDIAERSEMMPMTTGSTLQGYEIKQYLGVLSGEVVLGTGFLSEYNASFADFFGTESDAFSNKLDRAREGALTRMKRQAVLRGANAVIGIEFDYIAFGRNMVGVVANGTAVVAEPIE